MALGEFFQANSGFLPHGYCLLWKPGLLWTLVGSDIVIALSYFSIPMALVWFTKKQPGMQSQFRAIFWMFGAFITACGFTHLIEVVNIWRPIYATSAGVKFFTALVSVMTASVLWFLVPKAAAFIDDHRRLKDELSLRNQELQEALQVAHESEKMARASEQRFRQTQAAAPIGIAVVSLEGQFTSVNAALASMLGYSEKELIKLTFQEITHPDDLEADLAHVNALLNGQRDTYRMEKRYFHRSGRVIQIQLDGSIVRDLNNRPLYFIAMVQDITDKKANETALRQSRAKFKSLLENLPTAVVVHHNDTSIEYGNPTANRLLGLPPPTAKGRASLNQNWRLLDEDGKPLNTEQFPVNRVLHSGRPLRDATMGVERPHQKSPTWVKVDAFPMPSEDARATQVVVAFTDITDRKAMQDELILQARTDGLTGLFNRRHFMAELDQEFARASRFKHSLSLVMLDLDFFKRINDTQGHPVGDQVLRLVGDICQQLLRKTDIAARMGGEEFALILPQIDAAQALDAAERLRTSLAAQKLPLPSGVILSWTASMGVATLHESDITPVDLMRRADEALYTAKDTGRNCVCLAPVPSKRNVRRLIAQRSSTPNDEIDAS